MNLKDLINILIDADKKQENKESGAIEDVKTVKTDSVETPKEEIKQTEVDPRDDEIKELKAVIENMKTTIGNNDVLIRQQSEQISALKDLTSVDNPINNNEINLQELIEKGEF